MEHGELACAINRLCVIDSFFQCHSSETWRWNVSLRLVCVQIYLMFCRCIMHVIYWSKIVSFDCARTLVSEMMTALMVAPAAKVKYRIVNWYSVYSCLIITRLFWSAIFCLFH